MIITRVINDMVRNRKNYLEIAVFLNFEKGSSRAENSIENENHKQIHLSCWEVITLL